jgi:hypothetical protein
MDSQTFPVQLSSSAKFLFDKESPFASFYFREGNPASASQTNLRSPTGFSSISSICSQHRYCLWNGNGNDNGKGKGKGRGSDQPWLTLLMSSRSPKPEFLPLFVGKDSISGTVELELAKPETVREVKVTVCVVYSLRHMHVAIDLPPISSRAAQLIFPRNRILSLKRQTF